MDKSVLGEDWLPPRLLFREEKVKLLAGLEEPGVYAVVGPFGTGKTSLVRLALPHAVYVDCGVKKTHQAVRRAVGRLVQGRVIVLDDYTLARRSEPLRKLVSTLARENVVILVCHPSIRAELAGMAKTTVEMPPYSDRELYAILEDRVIRGELPVAEEALEAISERIGYPKGSGSARLAIISLKKALEICTSHRDPEVTERHVQVAFRLLSLY